MAMSNKYRKKPVVVEAFQMTTRRRWNPNTWPKWLHEAWNRSPYQPGAVYPVSVARDSGRLLVRMSSGNEELVFLNDWIVRDATGELSVIPPDVFAATYEKVGNDA